jgi:hypothetical protein
MEEIHMKRIAFSLLAAAFALPLSAQVPQIPLKIYAQHLVDEAAAKNPDLLVIMMHVTPDKSPDNVIIASNIGRIGKKGDEDDMRVINTGKSNLEISHGGDRFEVELVLQEASKLTVGALGLVFPYKAGDDKAALERKAIKIRDDLSKRIIHVKQLLEPHPYVALATTKTHAQKLVNATMAKHPELLIFALHISDGTDYPIIGSSIGRIGKTADEDDLGVIKTGKPVLEVNAGTGKRFEVEVQLKDLSGKVVGAMSAVFPYKAGDAEAGFLKQAEAIKDELQKQIPSLESLVALDP